MTAIVPPDLQALFDDLVERHGGVSKFTAAQIEVATIAVKVMRDLRCAAVGETVKLADTLVKLLERLPPPRPQSRDSKSSILTPDMSLHEMAKVYAQLIGDTDPDPDDYVSVGPVIDGTVDPPEPAPQPPAAAPPPAPPPRTASPPQAGVWPPVAAMAADPAPPRPPRPVAYDPPPPPPPPRQPLTLARLRFGR
jgi:hypothetical protein